MHANTRRSDLWRALLQHGCDGMAEELEPRVRPDRSGALLAVVFMVVIGSFLASSLFAQYASAEIGGHSEELSENVTLTIEHLAGIRGHTVLVELALSHGLNGAPTEGNIPTVEEALTALRSAVQEYLLLPLLPDEREVYGGVQQSWARFEEVVRHVEELEQSGSELARSRLSNVYAAGDALIQASTGALEFNVAHGRLIAERISRTRRGVMLIANGLTAICVMLGVAGGVLLHRQARGRHARAEERAKLLQERAAELELFAGRVAHDIRTPCNTAALAAKILVAKGKDEDIRSLGHKIARSMKRTDAILTDLLQFARAGGRPDPGARASPAELIGNLAPEVEPEAVAKGIRLQWHPIPPVLVGCSDGVYVSLLSNLLRNAIKYGAVSPEPAITVAVTDEGDVVRTEVQDTGPGIAKSEKDILFEPYFRGNNIAGREGLGLGLATVRKLVESHGGQVGVISAPNGGSRFWFTLPRAGSCGEEEGRWAVPSV